MDDVRWGDLGQDGQRRLLLGDGEAAMQRTPEEKKAAEDFLHDAWNNDNLYVATFERVYNAIEQLNKISPGIAVSLDDDWDRIKHAVLITKSAWEDAERGNPALTLRERVNTAVVEWQRGTERFFRGFRSATGKSGKSD